MIEYQAVLQEKHGFSQTYESRMLGMKEEAEYTVDLAS